MGKSEELNFDNVIGMLEKVAKDADFIKDVISGISTKEELSELENALQEEPDLVASEVYDELISITDGRYKKQFSDARYAKQDYINNPSSENLRKLVECLERDSVIMLVDWNLSEDEEEELGTLDVGDEIHTESRAYPELLTSEDGETLVPIFTSFLEIPREFLESSAVQLVSLTYAYRYMLAAKEALDKPASIVIDVYSYDDLTITDAMLKEAYGWKDVFCTNCGDDLEKQSGFSPFLNRHKCEKCGQLLLNPYMDQDELKYPYITWYCDDCEDCLSEQEGFSDWNEYWVCKKCGKLNHISEEDIDEPGEVVSVGKHIVVNENKDLRALKHICLNEYGRDNRERLFRLFYKTMVLVPMEAIGDDKTKKLFPVTIRSDKETITIPVFTGRREISPEWQGKYLVQQMYGKDVIDYVAQCKKNGVAKVVVAIDYLTESVSIDFE